MRPATSTFVRAVSQTRVVGVWKIVEYAGLAAFTVTVPRLMGPNQYGQFAALVSLLTLLVSVSGLGGLATFGRFLPQYELSGDRASARALFVQLFWIRAGVAIVFAMGLMVLIPSLLPGLSAVGLVLAATALVPEPSRRPVFRCFSGRSSLASGAARMR